MMKLMVIAAVVCGMVCMTGCKKEETPAEKAQSSLQQAAKDVQKAAQAAAKDVQKAADATANEAKKAADQATK